MWYLVLSTLVPGAEEGRRAHLQEHMDWLLDLHRRGRVLLSGPTSDREVGIYVMLGEELEETERIVGTDPHHVYGERTAAVYEWDVMQAMRLDDDAIGRIEAMVCSPEGERQAE